MLTVQRTPSPFFRCRTNTDGPAAGSDSEFHDTVVLLNRPSEAPGVDAALVVRAADHVAAAEHVVDG